MDSVEIYFSGSNHYTSAGIVVRTTKINFNRQVMRADLAQDYRAIWNLMTLYVHIDSHNQLTRY